VIDTYVRDFGRWTVGSAEHRDAVVRELQAHLLEAQEAGLLEQTLERLGSPREAARVFSEGHPLRPATLRWRVPAAVADLLPLTALLFAAYWHPDWPGPDLLDVTRFALIGLAVLWWNVVLPITECQTGRTPGKRMFGLRVVSEDGTAVSPGQALLRRVPTFFGFPLLVVDLPVALRDQRHRRAFDRVAGTVVVKDREEDQAPDLWRVRELEAHALVYLFVNLIFIYLYPIGRTVADIHFFWPIVSLLGWSIALAVHAWRVVAGSREKGTGSPGE
jgi:uncharacterized RDD family membrane protein YckC